MPESLTIPFWTVVLACFIDILVGDPSWFPHPVRWVGRLIDILDREEVRSSSYVYFLGILLALFLPGVVVFLTGISLYWLKPFTTIYNALVVFLIWSCVSLRSLYSQGLGIYKTLIKGNLQEARSRLDRLVGRRTDNLDQSEISRGSVETLAEGLLDGIVSPLFWLLMVGVPGIVFYKSVNTLDSMVGYRNDRYREFGWASAKLDDGLNWIPARLCVFLIPTISFFSGDNYRGSFRIGMRDRLNHPSPNAGHPEAFFAGALDCRLGGRTEYDGFSEEKPTINRQAKTPNPHHVYRGTKLLMACGVVWESFVLFVFFL